MTNEPTLTERLQAAKADYQNGLHDGLGAGELLRRRQTVRRLEAALEVAADQERVRQSQAAIASEEDRRDKALERAAAAYQAIAEEVAVRNELAQWLQQGATLRRKLDTAIDDARECLITSVPDAVSLLTTNARLFGGETLRDAIAFVLIGQNWWRGKTSRTTTDQPGRVFDELIRIQRRELQRAGFPEPPDPESGDALESVAVDAAAAGGNENAPGS